MNNTNNKKEMKTQRKNKAWLRNPDQRKNPKIFQAKFVQRMDGSFHMLGRETMVLSRKNAVASEWVPVDTRDFATELRMRGIHNF
jgi:hypothetical protein